MHDTENATSCPRFFVNVIVVSFATDTKHQLSIHFSMSY